MSRPQFAAVRNVVGGDDVSVLAVGPTSQDLAHAGGDVILPIWYREGAQPVRAGDRLGTWVDVSTRYVMATR